MKPIITFLFVHSIQPTCELILDSVPPRVKLPDISTHKSECMKEVFLYASKTFMIWYLVTQESVICYQWQPTFALIYFLLFDVMQCRMVVSSSTFQDNLSIPSSRVNLA